MTAQSTMPRNQKRGLLPVLTPPVLVVAAFALVFWGGGRVCSAQDGPETLGPAAAKPAKADAGAQDDFYPLLELFADALDQIDRNYVKQVDRRKLMEAAVRGMLAELDPYSEYVSPEDLDRFRQGVENRFGGIGIQLSVEAGRLIVISPLVDTPAYRAGLMPGDHVVKIDGKSTDGFTIDDAIRHLKGEVGTQVTLTVVHSHERDATEVTLEREVIRVRTVMGARRKADDTWDFMLDDEAKIGYVRITAFGRPTASELRKTLDGLTVEGMRGLILDLRFNPGGLLSSAVDVSDMFISKGRIVATKSRNASPLNWEAHEFGTFGDFEVAVLVNRFTASAAEIVAACLKDHGRAVVVGQRTWGKGSVQNVIELEGGRSILKLTTAGYHRPNGQNIHRFPDSTDDDAWGVRPSDGFEVRFDTAENRRLLDDWRARDVVTPGNDDEPVEEPGDDAPPPFADRQLHKAIDYVRGRLAEVADAKARPSEKNAEAAKAP